MFDKMFHKSVLPFLLLIGFGILYVHNLSPSVYGGDVGDFVTAASVGGVAHPPGYPFFVFLGFILIHTLHFFTPAFAMGLISAVSGVLGILCCYQIVQMLTKSRTSALIAAITLGLSYLYWFYAEIAEVFALHSFFILCLFYVAILFDKRKKAKFLFLFSFVLGLASITHQTIVLFIPSFLLIIFPAFIRAKKKTLLILQSLVLFILPFFFYIYIFVASSHHPVINWDNVHDIASFLRLFLRQDYGTLQAGAFPKPTFIQTLIILRTYLFSIVSQVTIPVLVVSGVGIIGLWNVSKRYVIAFVLAFVLSGPLFIGYARFPLQSTFLFGIYERFFTMSTLSIFFLFGYGLYILGKVFAGFFHRPSYRIVLQLIFLLIPLQLFFFNMPKTDMSQVWIGDTLGKDFLTPLPHNSILLIGGDTALFNTWYVHYALHFRPDVRLINYNLAYLDPYVIQQEKSVQKYYPHVQGTQLIARTIQTLSQHYPVYSYDQLEAPHVTDLKWVPTGLTYRLLTNTPDQSTFLATVKKNLSQVHLPFNTSENYQNFTIAEIPELYAKPLWSIGNYVLNSYKDVPDATYYYQQSIQIDPTYENSYKGLGLIYLSQASCSLAQKNLQKALDLQPFDQFPYFLLYTTYIDCLHNQKKASSVVNAYNKEFGANFFTDFSHTLKDLKK